MDLDPYDVLELPRNASEADIKRAFRRLSLRHHPDRNHGNRASEERFKLITAAYHRLKDASWSLPHSPWSEPAERAEKAAGDEDTSARFWADGAPIHYPTPEEIASLMRDVAGIKRRRQLRAHAQRVGMVLARFAVWGLAALMLTGAVALAYRVSVDLWQGW